MEKVVVLEKTSEKFFSESEIVIEALDLKVVCISVPCKRKLKRKDKEKLLKLISIHEKVFTSEHEFLEYEKGVVNKAWLNYFIIEGLNHLKVNNGEKIAVECNRISNLLKETVLCLGERYRIVELYSNDKDNVSDFVRTVYNSVGLPVNVRLYNGGYDTRYIVRVEENITIFDSKKNLEYKDVGIEYLYPLNKYLNLPLEKILKAGLEQRLYTGIIQKGVVKISGEISK